MQTHFNVESKKIDDTKKFIRTLGSARFLCNPFRINDIYRISLELSSEDGNKLSIYLESLIDEPIKKDTLFQRIYNKFILKIGYNQ